MNSYERLADEMLELLDSRGRPAPESVDASLRGEMAVLRMLDRMGESVSAGELSRELEMTTSRMAAVLNSLERKGMVERIPDASDRRKVRARLTQRGSALCAERHREVRDHMILLLTRLGEDDAGEFLRLLGRVFEIMPQIHRPPHAACRRQGEESNPF